ncbi:MAG: CGNR zinc finger domain-containing protein [Nocardioidaceae bacterium]|nr:CGNR zinc finger domain-containing protein [Nocardioidaceae bacterium]
MDFTHDTQEMLQMTASLVNTAQDDGEELRTVADLDAFLAAHPISGSRAGTADEVGAVRAMRTTVAAAWDVEHRDDLVALVNDLFARTDARPYLSRHDEWDWHLHVADGGQPLADRIGAEAAMGLADLVRADDLDRLRRCEAQGCGGVLVDLSRNRSRRFCSTTCANRTHVAAFRSRRASS